MFWPRIRLPGSAASFISYDSFLLRASSANVRLVTVLVRRPADSLIPRPPARVGTEGPRQHVHLRTDQLSNGLVEESLHAERHVRVRCKGTEERSAVVVVDDAIALPHVTFSSCCGTRSYLARVAEGTAPVGQTSSAASGRATAEDGRPGACPTARMCFRDKKTAQSAIRIAVFATRQQPTRWRRADSCIASGLSSYRAPTGNELP